MGKILILDNYDSFTYNLYHLVRELCDDEIDVIRNDKINLDDVAKYDRIILSPGSGIPEEAGLLLPLIQRYAPMKRILGVCLGHQAIGQAFGASLLNLTNVYHGIQTDIDIIGNDYIFAGLGNRMPAGRYHSWVIRKETLPKEFQVTAMSDDGEIMAICHRKYDVHGIQFHPESVLTPSGKAIIENFIHG